MAVMQTVDEQLARIATGNRLYTYNKNDWRYYLESYMGGPDYKRGQHLQRYTFETDGDYSQRLNATPLENHCRAVVNVYNSFLFREPPDRDYGTLTGFADVEDFEDNIDLDDRDIKGFMKVLIDYSPKLISALVILFIGIYTIRFINNLVKRIMIKRNLDPTLSKFLADIFRSMFLSPCS